MVPDVAYGDYSEAFPEKERGFEGFRSMLYKDGRVKAVLARLSAGGAVGANGSGVRALLDHAREKRLDQKRAICPVCNLEQGIRDQLAAASQHGITRKEQVLWLKEAVGVEITIPELNAHFSGRHDE